jgi:hypothetical protein
MKLCVALGIALALPGCSSNQNAGPVSPDAAPDVGAHDAAPEAAEPTDCGCVETTPAVDAAPMDAAPMDATSDAASDAGDAGDAGDAATELDASCPPSWSLEPTVDPTIAVPADGGVVFLHAQGSGTQNYACEPASDGGFGWTFVGPQASLSDCHGAAIGQHFASDAGASAPEWMLTADDSYAVGQKVAAFDGGAASIPWLLLRTVGHSDSGALAAATYVQRINTDGGLQPTSSCGADSGLQTVPYAADYYFYAP